MFFKSLISMFIFGPPILSVSEKGVPKTNNCNVDLYLSSCCLAIALIYLEFILLHGHMFTIDMSPCSIISFTGTIPLAYLFLLKFFFVRYLYCFPRFLFSYIYLVYIFPSFYFHHVWVLLIRSLVQNILVDSVSESNLKVSITI